MSKYKALLLARWVSWAVLWTIVNPELLSLKAWSSDPALIGPSVGYYFITGVIMELIYRLWAWGGLRAPYPHRTVTRPECPENPWISLMDSKPKAGEHFEVFCADGQTREGFAVLRDGGTETGIVLSFSSSDTHAFEKNPWPFRPTHWRYPKNESSDLVSE